MLNKPLSEAEDRLIEAAGAGTLVDLSSGDPLLDNPAQADTWSSARSVRTELLVALLTETQVPEGGGVKAVRLRGARIEGPLDLEAATLLCPLLLQDCHFALPINFTEATALSISLPGCHAPGLNASYLVVRNNLALNNGFTTTGEIRLVGARVGGALNFRGAHLSNPAGYAVQAARLTVDGSMFCDDGFAANGEIGLLGAHIGNVLAFGPSNFDNPNGRALFAPRLIVDGEMSCRGGLVAHGEVNLIDAHIKGSFTLHKAQLINPDGFALMAAGINTEGDISCRDINPRGTINLFGARVSRRLDFRGATLKSPGGLVLDLERLRVPAKSLMLVR